MDGLDTEYRVDDWVTEDTDYDGKDVLTLVRSGNSPFKGWDINLLIQEVENNLGAQVIDIPSVSEGANYYGFHIKLSNSLDIVARLARGDVNMPNYNGFPFEMQGPEVEFEAETYRLLRSYAVTAVPHLLYYRVPLQYPAPRLSVPKDIMGRRLFLFEKTEGEKNVWCKLSPDDKAHLLTQIACIRATLFNLNPPPEFVSKWCFERLYIQRPEVLPTPIAPTREFLTTLVTSKIEEKIKNIGDKIGWEGCYSTVGPIAFAAKQSLLRFVPHIIPKDCDDSPFYRLVLEHGDYGIHNMSITKDECGRPLVTSLYDWETGCFVPAILSDPVTHVKVALVADENAGPSFKTEDDASPDDRAEYMLWAEQYFEVLYKFAPEYKNVICAGKDVRHLWFGLRHWDGDNAEDYFGELGRWAEKRMKELECCD